MVMAKLYSGVLHKWEGGEGRGGGVAQSVDTYTFANAKE